MKGKQLEFSEARPVKSNLLLTNCFLRDVIPPKDIHRGNKVHEYCELVREVKPEGIIETMKVVPYPHTVDSVKSYAEAADYRNDPVSAMYQASKNSRKNLGDIRETQNILKLDSQQAQALLKTLQEAFAKANEVAQANSDKDEVGSPPSAGAPNADLPSTVSDGGRE